MKQPIRSVQDLGHVIRAVRKHSGVRQDDLAGIAHVSRQFAVDVERGKPTIQMGRVFRLLDELGLQLTVDVPDVAVATLDHIRARHVVPESDA